MKFTRQQLFGAVLLALGLGVLWWALLSGAFAPTYYYNAEPLSEDSFTSPVTDFAELSEPARRGIRRAIESGDTAVLRGEENRAPEFSFGDGCYGRHVRYDGNGYRICTLGPTGNAGLYRALSKTFTTSIGLVLLAAGTFLFRRDYRLASEPAESP